MYNKVLEKNIVHIVKLRNSCFIYSSNKFSISACHQAQSLNLPSSLNKPQSSNINCSNRRYFVPKLLHSTASRSALSAHCCVLSSSRVWHLMQRFVSTGRSRGSSDGGSNDEGDEGTATNGARSDQPPLTKEEKHQKLYAEGPYPHNVTESKRSQARFSYRPSVTPSATTVILFPGQGTQYVGMGRDLLDVPGVQDLFAAASAVLEFDLLEACLNGPDVFLSRTQVQQPAILVCSLAALYKLQQDAPAVVEACIACAGFSVGEITALTFAGALSFEDAVRLIKVRAEAMQAASEAQAGGLLTVFTGHDSLLGLACEAAKNFCLQRGVGGAECRVANYLAPQCRVVGGSEEALQFLQDNAKEFRLKRVKRLRVSGAFHTDHMRSAAAPISQVLGSLALQAPSVAVHSNIDGRPYRHPQQLKRNLPRQVYSSVKWEQTLHVLYERHPHQEFPVTYECGPGQSLRAILKMVNMKAWASSHAVEA